MPQLAASSLKAALDADWDDPVARDHALAEVLDLLDLLDRVEGFIAGQVGEQAAAAAVATARQVRDQDIALTGPASALRRGVAKDLRISVEDRQMRHRRKSRSALFDGFKRHVLRDLDTGLVPAVGITPANAPEVSVTGDIAADLQAAGRILAELHIDRAYLSSALVRDRGPDLTIFCKAWRVRNAGGRWPLERPPLLLLLLLLLETSMPGVFSAGDVRHRSVKRVASAVGEGAIAVQLLHEYLQTLHGSPHSGTPAGN